MIILPCPEQIRMARAGLGWSQELLADKSGLSVETIKRAESGANVTTESLTSIATAFAAFTVTFEPYNSDDFNDHGGDVPELDGLAEGRHTAALTSRRGNQPCSTPCSITSSRNGT